jgi:hypothetical protein
LSGGLNLFVRPPDPLERHQTLAGQGFDAVGTIFAYIYRVYIFLEIVNLLRKFTQFFLAKKLPVNKKGFFSFFVFL